MTVKIGTRKSRMAIAQTDEVIRQLSSAHKGAEFEKVLYETPGDLNTTAKLSRQGGKGGAFVESIRQAVRDRGLDAAMHSLKDMPGNEETPGLTIGAYLKRENAQDCLVLRADRTENDLRAGSYKIGTTSVRRASFLKNLYPGCEVIHFRGAVTGTDKSRLYKLDNSILQETDEGIFVGPADALVLAASGLARVGEKARCERLYSFDEMLPAVGQGIVAVECRCDDYKTLETLSEIDDPDARRSATAERELLWILNGHCNSPIAAICTMDGSKLKLQASVMSIDGSTRLDTVEFGEPTLPRELGRKAAFSLLRRGAGDLIEDSRL